MNPHPLKHNQTYHIYNRGNNGETLFRQKRNYHHFLTLYTKHIVPIATTYAYCLMPNHFHLLVRINDNQKPGRFDNSLPTPVQDQNLPGLDSHKQTPPSKSFSNLFNAYTKAINNAYGRTGSLFEKPFHRKPVHDATYFWNLVIYIHQNPQHHHFVDDFRDWPYTSYRALTTPDHPTKIARDALTDWFGGRETVVAAHTDMIDLDLTF